MPIPTPHKDEDHEAFMSRCHATIADEYDDAKQRHAICQQAWDDKDKERGRRMTIERRATATLEVRQGQGGRPRLFGYAAIFNSRSLELSPGFVEVIRPGAFTRTLREYPDIRAFVDHDPSMIIGRVSAGTLKVAEDDHGLRVEISPPDTQVGRDVIENVRVGNLAEMSFAFSLYDRDSERWDLKSKPPVREILSARVYEASVVATPAYPDTSIAVRSLEHWRDRMPRIERLEAEWAKKLARR